MVLSAPLVGARRAVHLMGAGSSDGRGPGRAGWAPAAFAYPFPSSPTSSTPGARGRGRHRPPPYRFGRPRCMPRILRVNFVRRHPIAVVLLALVLWSARNPLPALVDVATGAPAGAAELARPAAYVVGAPLSDVLDALTFLSRDRAKVLLGVWAAGLFVYGFVRRASWGRRARRAATRGSARARRARRGRCRPPSACAAADFRRSGPDRDRLPHPDRRLARGAAGMDAGPT